MQSRRTGPRRSGWRAGRALWAALLSSAPGGAGIERSHREPAGEGRKRALRFGRIASRTARINALTFRRSAAGWSGVVIARKNGAQLRRAPRLVERRRSEERRVGKGEES